MKYLVLNWKLFPESETRAIELVNSICESFNKLDLPIQKKYKLILCPPSIFISPIQKFLIAKNFENILSLGGQNAFYHNRGAYTGEISPTMLKSFDVKYCLVGHSERRLLFKETDEDINGKIRTLLNQNIKPILCLGENSRTKKEDFTSFKIKNKLFDQMSSAFKNNQPEEMKEVILCYEPVWAISANEPTSMPDPEDTRKIIGNIKFWIETRFNEVKLRDIPVIYGGSVDDSNIKEYLEISDGVLIGNASTKKPEILRVIKNLN